MRIPPTTGMAAAAALVLAGFLTGWFFGPRPSAGVPPAPPPATTPVAPREDVPGADVPGMPRYPGSVRILYEREDLGETVATEAEYATADGPEDVRKFYRGVFEGGGWAEADVGFDRGEIFYFVIKGEREVRVEVEEHVEFTEVEIEVEEPSP